MSKKKMKREGLQSMNNTCFLGRITKDPELRHTNAGTSYCRFTLAVNRMKTQDGKETADFIPCVCWTKTAENLTQYVIKGQQLLVQGRLQSGSYQDNSGNTRYTLEINAFRIEFLQKPRSATENSNNSSNYDDFYPVPDENDLPF